MDMRLFYTLIWTFFTLVVCGAGIPLLMLICWLIDKYLLHGRFKKKYRIILSVAIPVLFVVVSIASVHIEPYNTTHLNDRLAGMGLGVELPEYKIVDYTEEFVETDLQETYELEFEDDEIMRMVPLLDSLCDANSHWSKDGESYQCSWDSYNYCTSVRVSISPMQKNATCVMLWW